MSIIIAILRDCNAAFWGSDQACRHSCPQGRETQGPEQTLPGTNGAAHLQLPGACTGRALGPCQGSVMVGSGVGRGRKKDGVKIDFDFSTHTSPAATPQSRDPWSLTVLETQKPPERLSRTHAPSWGKGRGALSRTANPGSVFLGEPQVPHAPQLRVRKGAGAWLVIRSGGQSLLLESAWAWVRNALGSDKCTNFARVPVLKPCRHYLHHPPPRPDVP